MRKRLLLTSVAVLNTLATVAVPTVVSAETTDTNTNIEEIVPTTDTDDTIETEAVADPNVAVSNEAPDVIKGPEVSKADPTVAHANDIEGFEVAKENALSRSWSSQMAWAEQIGPWAQKSAQRYNLYASVMMAQAIIESGWGKSSLAMPPNHNLFGIKGSYHGQSVSMRTAEWSQRYGWYYITANFAKYPTYEQSFDDNGNKLRNGLTYNHSFYRGTWKENTRSYRDATAWLQGRYATAPNYAATLNNIISSYDLTRYDRPVQEPETNAGSDAPINGTRFDMSDIGIVKNPHGAQIYTQAHPDLPSKNILKHGSDWQVTGKVVTPEGHLYYQVSTQEYVKASDLQLKSDYKAQSNQKVIKANNPKSYAVPLVGFDKSGQAFDGTRGLANGSLWLTDQVKEYQGHKYHRVSTNEWIMDSYVQFMN